MTTEEILSGVLHGLVLLTSWLLLAIAMAAITFIVLVTVVMCYGEAEATTIQIHDGYVKASSAEGIMEPFWGFNGDGFSAFGNNQNDGRVPLNGASIWTIYLFEVELATFQDQTAAYDNDSEPIGSITFHNDPLDVPVSWLEPWEDTVPFTLEGDLDLFDGIHLVGQGTLHVSFDNGVLEWRATFEPLTGGTAAVPEPSTLVLLGMGTLVVVLRKRLS